DTRPAINWNNWNRDGDVGDKAWRGDNPPAGALITYYLRTPQQVSLTVSEKNGGRAVRTLTAPGNAGMNRVTWDFAYDAPAAAAPAAGGRGGRGGRGGGGSIEALPGAYTVTLAAGS